MSSIPSIGDGGAYDPIDVAEQIAASENWDHERSHDDELVLCVPGSWCDYHISLTWREDLETLHMACMFDIKVPAAKRNDVRELLVRINELMWLGHFDMWSKDGGLMYRYGLLMAGGAAANIAQCHAMICLAIDACEQYLPAVQFVLWAGKGPAEALAAVQFETRGSA